MHYHWLGAIDWAERLTILTLNAFHDQTQSAPTVTTNSIVALPAQLSFVDSQRKAARRSKVRCLTDHCKVKKPEQVSE